MADRPRFYLTTAIDYPNSRPHIGTAFEKIGADVQARYRRMEGYEVHFLMGNDENTIKVARAAQKLERDPKEYCDDMARQFKEVWRALDISFDDFIQTSEPRHHEGCRKFIQKVYDNGYIYKGNYEGWYCEGCESFKTEKELVEGKCPDHQVPAIKRTEPCHFFALSRFQDRLLQFHEENTNFVQPESRRNEVLAFIESGLQDVNITRMGQGWGIRVPFDPEFTIWVWFDALLNYITAIGYGSDEERFNKWWPADMHFIGKDITRFHCALWPAMLLAAGLEPPRTVFAHGFVYIKNEETGVAEKISKSLGNVVEPMEIITKFSAEAFRYYFLRECPFPSDGEFSWQRFAEVYNADLANNLGNLYSRAVKLISQNYDGHLEGTAGLEPGEIYTEVDTETTVQQVEDDIEACRYNQALQKIWQQILDPANRYTDQTAPWKLVKSDRDAAKRVLYDMVEQLRCAAILLKPFLPRSAETIYRSFNFKQPWEEVRCEDVWVHPGQTEDLRVLAKLEDGKVKPLFPRIRLSEQK
ncbi:MAG: methionine--tRNA ligase [Gemmataceae bacterium]|nr:methionine--tRNA ligase [Gemmataceae bacterium]